MVSGGLVLRTGVVEVVAVRLVGRVIDHDTYDSVAARDIGGGFSLDIVVSD